MQTAQIPESHVDLVDGPHATVLTTVMPNGQPQATPVWCNRSNAHVLINTMRGFRKYKNMRSTPHVSLLIYRVDAPLRNIEIRGTVVEMTEDDAEAHLDALTQLYMNKPDAKFFGDCISPDLRTTHIPVRIAIAPNHVRVEG
jgi:PPOX class probable F420-dependent enzyme